MSSIGENEVPVPMHIKFPVVPDCGNCLIRRCRLQRGTESDDAGITTAMSGDPQNMSSIGKSEAPVPMDLRF